jgi:YbbR domain-containing protein
VVTGPRNVIGSLTKDDVIVYPQFSNVREAGRYSLALNAIKTSSVLEYQIESLSSYQSSVRFDRLVEKEFSVDIDVSNLTIPGEFMVDKIYATPGTVTVKGPENSVNIISKVVATVEPQEIAQSSVLPATLTLYDENGDVVDSTFVTFNQEEFTITVPVLSEVVLPVKVDYINVPAGFDTNTLNVKLSQETIRLAVPTRTAQNLTEYVIGYIDLKTLETDRPYVFDITMAANYRNMDDVTQISATVSHEGLTSKTVTIQEIKVLNQGNQNVEVLTQKISNVEIVGETSVVEALSDGSVIAQIDMSHVSLAQGQQTVEVDVIIPSTGKAYAKGTYYVTIKN